MRCWKSPAHHLKPRLSRTDHSSSTCHSLKIWEIAVAPTSWSFLAWRWVSGGYIKTLLSTRIDCAPLVFRLQRRDIGCTATDPPSGGSVPYGARADCAARSGCAQRLHTRVSGRALAFADFGKEVAGRERCHE